MADDDWFLFYYANPRPERFVAEVRALAAKDLLKGSNLSLKFVAFLSRLMAANPERIATWLTELADLDPEARSAVEDAAWLSNTDEGRRYLARNVAGARPAGPPPDLLDLRCDDAVVLDVLWSYYFATGDRRAIRRIVSALDFMSGYGSAARFEQTEKTDADRRRAMNDAVFQAASWSLADLMGRHRPLQSMCEDILSSDGLTPNERCGLALALEKADPARWHVEIDAQTSQAAISRRT